MLYCVGGTVEVRWGETGTVSQQHAVLCRRYCRGEVRWDRYSITAACCTVSAVLSRWGEAGLSACCTVSAVLSGWGEVRQVQYHSSMLYCVGGTVEVRWDRAQCMLYCVGGTVEVRWGETGTVSQQHAVLCRRYCRGEVRQGSVHAVLCRRYCRGEVRWDRYSITAACCTESAVLSGWGEAGLSACCTVSAPRQACILKLGRD
jgi:hypothetical protein